MTILLILAVWVGFSLTLGAAWGAACYLYDYINKEN
jgi:hypothetical protein